MKPKRIQLSRRKGFRLPPNTVSVARPTRWGNPFVVHEPIGDPQEVMADAQHGVCFSREAAVNRFRRMIRTAIDHFEKKSIRSELRGKNLACWCPLYICDKCGGKYSEQMPDDKCITNLSEKGHGAWRCRGKLIRQPCHADVLLKIANG